MPEVHWELSTSTGQGKTETLHVLPTPHSTTFVLFNDALFFTRDNTMTMIYHHDYITSDQGTVMFLRKFIDDFCKN
jgi:hypothetical protein